MSNPSLSLWQSVSDACQKDDALCRGVLKVTDNEWLAAASDWLIAKPFSVLLIVLIAFVARWFLHRMIDRVTTRAAEGLPTPVLKHKKSVAQEHTAAVVAGRRVQRAQTMGSLLKSIASIVIFTIAGITALAEVGVAVGPLIASAGIVGVALGFGAQSLVSDFLSGIFMIIEDQYGVGDAVDLGEAVGTVEAVGLRVTRLRDVEGTVWYSATARSCASATRARTGRARSSTYPSRTSRTSTTSSRSSRTSPTRCGRTRTSAR